MEVLKLILQAAPTTQDVVGVAKGQTPTPKKLLNI